MMTGMLMIKFVHFWRVCDWALLVHKIDKYLAVVWGD